MSPVDLGDLEHDSNEESRRRPKDKQGDVTDSELPTAMGAVPERKSLGPQDPQRQRMRAAMNIESDKEWLNLENPAIWEGDIE